LLKGGIVFSRLITTVSPRYASEIQTPEYGYGFEGLLGAGKDRLLKRGDRGVRARERSIGLGQSGGDSRFRCPALLVGLESRVLASSMPPWFRSNIGREIEPR
jgi:hypothetical protein